MNDIAPFGGGLAKRDSRQVSRELSRLEGRGRVELARIRQEADLQAERVSAVGYVGKRAQYEVAMVSQIEIQLSAVMPSKAARLEWVGDMTVLAIADLVSETVRRVK